MTNLWNLQRAALLEVFDEGNDFNLKVLVDIEQLLYFLWKICMRKEAQNQMNYIGRRSMAWCLM